MPAIACDAWKNQDLVQTGLRLGGLVAVPGPRHLDSSAARSSSRRPSSSSPREHSPTGERNIVKPYPKNDKPGVIGLRQGLLDRLAARIQRMGLAGDDLLVPRPTSPAEPRSPAASVACPHNGTSTVGVNQRSRYRPSDGTTNAVSARLFSAATACSRASSRNRSSTTTAAGLPAKRRVAKASSWKIGTRMAAS